MSVPMFYNEITNQWEPIVTSDRLPIIDLGKNYNSDNLEGALQEIAKWKNDIGSGSLGLLGERMDKAESDIEWLKAHGGGGGTGAVAPTITSTIPDGSTIKLNSGEKLEVPVIFSSANLGQGICYIMIDNVEVNTQTIKQGSNNINIGVMENLKSTLTLYAKDRAGLVSNSLTWTVINGGINLDVKFDSTADYVIGTEIVIPYYVTTGSEKSLTMNINIDYDSKSERCNTGYNDYAINGLGVGIHAITMQITDGEFESNKVEFNIIVIDSEKLYLTTDFDNSDQTYGVPISINYRISYGETDKFPVKLYLDNAVYKELTTARGNYYWIIDDRLEIGPHTYKIELINGTETLKVEGTFNVVKGEYTPVELAKNGLIYRLNPSTRTNTDNDREHPIINNCQTDLHNFNFSSNGWVDGELVCNTGSYVEIDFKPYLENATTGSTVEIYFKSFDVGNADAMVVDYRDTYTDKGFYIGLNDCQIASESATGTSFVCPDRYIKVSFVIDRYNKFAKVYIDGILSRAFKLTDSGSGVNTIYENFSHDNKLYINYNTRDQSTGYCIIKDIVAYRRALSDDEIVKNGLSYITDMKEQQLQYNFEFDNTSLPQVRMYASEEEIAKMTLEHKITMRIKYTSTNTEKYGQSFDLPYCQVGWQGTSSVGYVLKNYQVYLKDENMADYYYTPFPNGIPESTFCFKADYMESSHSRNVGLARLATDVIFDGIKNPSQQKDPKVRNSIDGFPVLMYINDKLMGVYDFNTDRYSYKAWGYTDEDNILSYEISANSDTTAGAFFAYDSSKTSSTELDYYKADFMPIYPPTRVAGNDDFNEIKRLVEYVDKSEEDNFRDNFEKYFNKKYVLRYLIFVHLFGLVDNLGKNARLTTWDGLIWWFQPYDCDTCISLDNSGFQKFDSDIEIGDKNVFNTTSSRLWEKVMLYFQEDIKQEYAELRNTKLNLKTCLQYLINDQLSKIPASMYNKDAKTKYLDFGETYLYACHGSGENLIKKWMSDRFIYMDSLYQYDTDALDYITLRSSKLGLVYIDLQVFSPMYFTIKWRNDASGNAIQRLRVGKNETVRFSYEIPTETDQEILLYKGYNIKDLGDLSNLQPTTISIANATRLTRLECHSSNLIRTDLSECTNLVNVDLSKCTALGTGVGAQSVLNVTKCDNLNYLNATDTSITAVQLNPLGSNIHELWLPKTVRSIDIRNCWLLTTLGLQFGHNCESLKLINCPNIQHFGDRKWNNAKKQYTYPNSYFLAGIKSLYLDESYDVEVIESLYNPEIKNVTLRNLKNVKELVLGPRIDIKNSKFGDDYYTPNKENIAKYEDFNITIYNCPNIDTFRTRTHYNRILYPDIENKSCLPAHPPDNNPNDAWRFSNYRSGFHCNKLDLTGIPNLKVADFGITMYVNKLILPSTVTTLILNPRKGFRKNPDTTTEVMDSYYMYAVAYGQNVGWLNGYVEYNAQCITGNLIYSIAPTEAECEDNIWKMDSYNLEDFDLGVYGGDDGNNRYDIHHNLEIQNLNLKCHKYSPLFSDNIHVTGNIDMTDYEGDYLVRTFYNIDDDVKFILPKSYDNIKYCYNPLRHAHTTQFDWKFGAFIFSISNDLYSAFQNTILKEQADESEKVSFINKFKYNSEAYNDDSGIFYNSNIKYIDKIELCSIRALSRIFYKNKNIISIGNITLNGTSDISPGRNLRDSFCRCTNLISVGNITIDFANTTWNMGSSEQTEYRSTFEGCSNLETLGNIKFINVNPDQITKIKNSLNKERGLRLDNMFNGCKKLKAINLDTGGLPVINLPNFMRDCSTVENIIMPEILLNNKQNVDISYAFCNCTNLKTIDFSKNDFFNSTDIIYFKSTFDGCKSLTSIIKGLDPDNVPVGHKNSECYDAIFSYCNSLQTFYKIPTDGRYYLSWAYANCTSMNIPENIIYDIKWKYKSSKLDSGDDVIQRNYTYYNDQQIKTVTINCGLSDEMKALAPDDNGYVNTRSYFATNLFKKCNSITTLTINIEEDIKKWKIVRAINLSITYDQDSSNYYLRSLSRLSFNSGVVENLGVNTIQLDSTIFADTLEYIDNYPLGHFTTDFSITSVFKSVTWDGQLTTSLNKNFIKSSYMPVSCLEDLINNHLAEVEGKTLTLGDNKKRVSESVLLNATNKGWTIA